MNRSIRLCTLLLGLLLNSVAHAGSFVINKVSGFSNSTATVPVGGNPGLTLGQQRSNAINYAANLWTGILQPSVNMTIDAQFTSLFCDAGGATLASSGPTFIDRDFAGAPYSNTWYPRALKNHIVSSSSGAVITASFNNQIEGNVGCLGGANWYYGYDHNPGPNQIDFLEIAMHEIGHGLGFITMVALDTGIKSSGADDIYMKFLRDNSLNKSWPVMTNAERVASAIDSGDLVWTGSAVQHVKSALSGGLTNGYPRMYAPSTLSIGSSVSHWNTNVTYSGAKNELMEPFYDTPFDMSLTVALMRDLGWNSASYDFDGDGTADHLDDFPHKNAANSDTDNDGKPDSWLGGSGCSGNTCSSLTLDWDDDNDGVPDTVDAAPLDAGNKTENNLPLDQTYKGLRYSSQRSH